MKLVLLHMLKNGTFYHELGANHFDNRAKGRQVLRLVTCLQDLGFTVEIAPDAARAATCFFLAERSRGDELETLRRATGPNSGPRFLTKPGSHFLIAEEPEACESRLVCY